MKILEAQKLLAKMYEKYGDTEIYFDCPKCGCSFAPNKLVAMAIHITEEKK